MAIALSTKEVKKELARRVEDIMRPEFVDAHIRPLVGTEAGFNGDVRTRVIQLDGTGAATVELTFGGADRVFAKLYPNESGAAIYEKLRTMRAEGFGPGSRYRAVEPLGFIEEYDMLLARGAEGPAVSDFVGADEEKLLSGVREAGRWLARLNSSGLRIGEPQSLLVSGELLSLARRLAKTVRARPDYADEAIEMIKQLETLAEDTADGIQVQTHGQYRPIHVFIGDEAVTVIDLDRSRPSDPSRDVAEFAHRLRMTVAHDNRPVEQADAATEAFLGAYASEVSDHRYLTNLRFHWARFIAHSLNRKMKPGDIATEELDPTLGLYRSEFDRVVGGRWNV